MTENQTNTILIASILEYQKKIMKYEQNFLILEHDQKLKEENLQLKAEINELANKNNKLQEILDSVYFEVKSEDFKINMSEIREDINTTIQDNESSMLSTSEFELSTSIRNEADEDISDQINNAYNNVINKLKKNNIVEMNDSTIKLINYIKIELNKIVQPLFEDLSYQTQDYKFQIDIIRSENEEKLMELEKESLSTNKDLNVELELKNYENNYLKDRMKRMKEKNKRLKEAKLDINRILRKIEKNKNKLSFILVDIVNLEIPTNMSTNKFLSCEDVKSFINSEKIYLRNSINFYIDIYYKKLKELFN